MSKATTEKLRQRYMKAVSDFLAKEGETVLQTGTNEYAIPCVDDEMNEQFMVITFKIPTGSRDGTPYDGYGDAESFKMEQAEKAEKAKEAAEKKAKKIARDAAARQAKAEAKAKYMAENGK